MRRAAKIDASHGPIVEALRQAGCSVYYMRGADGAPDLVCGISGQTHLIEVKPDVGVARRRNLRPNQVRWHQAWRGGPVALLRSEADALAWVASVRRGLPVAAEDVA